MRLLLLSIFLVVAPGLLFASDDVARPLRQDDFKKGMKYYHQKNYAKAVKHLDAYLENNPDPYAYYVKGYALYKMRRYREAVADFKDTYMVGPAFRLNPTKEMPKETAPKETAPKETPPKETSTKGILKGTTPIEVFKETPPNETAPNEISPK
jgi:hypothetical protein